MRARVWIVTLFLACSMLTAWSQETNVPTAGKPYTIGVVMDGECRYFEQLLALVKQELAVLMEDERPVVFKMDPAFNAGWDLDKVNPALDAALQDPEVDLVYANGILVAQAAAQPMRKLNKPVISGFAQDPDAVGLPYGKDGRSTKKNYNFVIVPLRSSRDLEVFHQLVPFKHLVVLMDSKLMMGLTEYQLGVQLVEQTYNAKVTVLPLDLSADEALARIPKDTDAVYLTPAMRMNTDEWQQVIDGLNARKLPVFALMGRPDVELGALAGLAPEEGERMARRIALNMEQIIGGIPPEDLPVPMSMDEELVINARTAMQIGFSPDLDLMTRSLFLHEECLDAGTRLELEEAIELALENNIDLAVERAKVGEKRQDRNKYLSNLFPQLDGNANYTQIDRDRAESSMGSQPEKETKIGATVSQIIFNDSALSAYRSSRRQFNSAQADQETTRLDVFADTARSFIELLQARALVRIDANNLNLTRSNLELARIRQQVGTAGPEEVLRWETQAAQQKADLIKSLSNMDKAQVALNQIMGLNLSSRWWPVDIQLSPTNYWFMGDRLAPYLRNDAQLKALEGYIEELAVRNSTELAALDENIAAQRIMLDLYRRQFIVPELGANFAYDRILKQETVGDNGGLLASEADDNEWSFGVQASLPLFQSGGQVFTVLRARAVLEQLTQTRRLTAERIRQQAKNVMYSLESSYPSMKLQQDAAAFAAENLKVTQDKYARGLVSILNLLDAQNQAFVANQNATIAVYTYLTDIINMQRAISWFEIEQSEAAKDRWVQDFSAFLDSGYIKGRGTGVFQAP